MAINKKLIHFKSKEAFDRELQTGNILDTSICFVPDAKFIYTRGEYWYCPYSKEEIDLMIADSSELTINAINLKLTLLQDNLEELLDSLSGKVGDNTYTNTNYISKETNLTDAVLLLDEEIKATNDNLALEHTNAEATYAKKTELSGYLPLTGGTITYKNPYSAFVYYNHIHGLGMWINGDPNSQFTRPYAALCKQGEGTTSSFNLVLINPEETKKSRGIFISTSGSYDLATSPTDHSNVCALAFGDYNMGVSYADLAITQVGIFIKDKTASDLLNAAGGTISISEIGTLLGESTLATKEELAEYLPLSGGTLTGDLIFPDGGISPSKGIRFLGYKPNEDNNYTNYICALGWYDSNNSVRYGHICYFNNPLDIDTSYVGITANSRNVGAVTGDAWRDHEGDYLFRISATKGVFYNTHKLVENTELSNYLTKTDASNTYQPKGNYLTIIPSEYVTDSELNAKGYQTEAQVAAKVASLVDSAPETLNTLNELAAALGDDPNFATTITNQIAQKADKTVATSSTDGLMSSADKTKVDKIVTNGDGSKFLNDSGTYTSPFPSVTEEEVLTVNPDGSLGHKKINQMKDWDLTSTPYDLDYLNSNYGDSPVGFQLVQYNAGKIYEKVAESGQWIIIECNLLS